MEKFLKGYGLKPIILEQIEFKPAWVATNTKQKN